MEYLLIHKGGRGSHIVYELLFDGDDEPQSITKPILESYPRYLYYYRQENGEPLSPTTRTRYLTNIKQFFKWLTQENYLLYNPASELILPKTTASLPVVLTEDEVEKLLHQPDISTPYGLRDRAILELFYSVGLRRTELCNLQVSDLFLSRQTVFVKEGKGGKDRLLPVGARAITCARNCCLPLLSPPCS